LIFWSKTPKTKEEKLKARQQRDLKALIHQEHVKSVNEMEAKAQEGAEREDVEAAPAEEGLDEDLGSKIGRKKQQAQTKIQEVSKSLAKIKSRRKSLGKSKSRARRRGKSLGF